MEAALAAYNEGFAEPFFIGKTAEIKLIIESFGYQCADFQYYNEADPQKCTEYAIHLIHKGKIKGIMKGAIETGTLMGTLLKSEHNLKASTCVCAMSLMEIPHYHKLLAASDPALSIQPSLEQKEAIIHNCTKALINLGITNPKIGILAAIEHANPKMPETLDAIELKRRNAAGEIKNCIIDGPLSYDLCLDSDAAKLKHLNSPVAGDPDLIIYPNLVTGNAVSKALVISAGAVGSSIILGTKVPIVLPSRSASVAEKVRNIMLAAGSCDRS